ncbi:MAG TPA: DUF6090 family protein [Robiginitalea sp.]|nr:DUF6090 family protein [Robiginitalea sp.]
MLKYLRQFRQRLLAKNQTGKYLLYAGGEIILVVIGILIALQINNWNEERLAREQESIYYCKIKEDLELDRNSLVGILEDNHKRTEIGKKLLLKLHQTPKDKSVIMDDYLSAVRSNVFYPNNSAITDITSSGKLWLLQDGKLKEQILRYYTDMDNFLSIVHKNQSEVTDRIFQYDNALEFGAHQTFYREEFGEELMALLPDVNWQRDKESPYFKKFEEHIAIAVIIAAREKQVLSTLQARIEQILPSLDQVCKVRPIE